MLGKAPLAAPYRHACFLSCMPCDWYSNSFIYHITRKGYIATSLLSLMGAGGPGETKRRLQSGEFPGCAGQAGGGWAVYSGESRGWQVYYILCLPAKRLQAFFCGRGAVCGWLRREDAASAGGVLLGAAALSPGCPQGCPQLSGGAEGCQQVIHRVIKTPEKTCPKKTSIFVAKYRNRICLLDNTKECGKMEITGTRYCERLSEPAVPAVPGTLYEE